MGVAPGCASPHGSGSTPPIKSASRAAADALHAESDRMEEVNRACADEVATTWDEELADLTEKAFAAFGDEAVGRAFVHALMSTPALDWVPTVVEQLMSRERGLSKCVDARTSAQYFKAELRRMLTQ